MAQDCLDHKILEAEEHARGVELCAWPVLVVFSRHAQVATVRDGILRYVNLWSGQLFSDFIAIKVKISY